MTTVLETYGGLSLSHTYSLTHSLSHTLSHTHFHTHTPSHSHPLCLSLTHTHTLSLTHTHSLSHTHTQTAQFIESVTTVLETYGGPTEAWEDTFAVPHTEAELLTNAFERVEYDPTRAEYLATDSAVRFVMQVPPPLS